MNIISRIKMSKLAVTCIACALFAVGVVSGTFVPSMAPTDTCGSYTYINADVVCGGPDVIKKTGYIQTREDLDGFIEQEKNAGRLAEAGVYFRDLKHGPVFGINELADFAPASLLKLPLAVVFLSSAETEPEVLTHKLLIQGTADITVQRIVPRLSAEVGRDYTIEELLRMMIMHSDNTSYYALEAFITNEPQRVLLRREIFQEIGLIDPKDRIEETINVRGYASLFRLLYNVSYLNDENSEKLLTWLAETDYEDGMAAGIPQHIAFAHKFGERYTNDYVQLHDCGIVYYPENPYLLCIMTRGSDFSELEQVIRTISEIVYKEVNSRKL